MDFFEGRYKDKVIQVDSSKTGAEEEEMIEPPAQSRTRR